jgi:hypothetical protein
MLTLVLNKGRKNYVIVVDFYVCNNCFVLGAMNIFFIDYNNFKKTYLRQYFNPTNFSCLLQ